MVQDGHTPASWAASGGKDCALDLLDLHELGADLNIPDKVHRSMQSHVWCSTARGSNLDGLACDCVWAVRTGDEK